MLIIQQNRLLVKALSYFELFLLKNYAYGLIMTGNEAKTARSQRVLHLPNYSTTDSYRWDNIRVFKST